MIKQVLLIAGSRSLATRHTSVMAVLQYYLNHTGCTKGNTIIIHGGARGVDEIAGKYALQNFYWHMVFPADWSKGKSAGLQRNQVMVDKCNCALLIWDGVSRGTQHSQSLLEQQGKPYQLYDYAKGGWV